MAEPTKQPEAVPAKADTFPQVLERLKKGDKTAILPARRFLHDPDAIQQLGGEMSHRAEVSFVSALAGDDLATKVGLMGKLSMLRDELAGPNPTPLETLLIERVVACWLQVQDADIRYAQAKNLSIAWGEYHQRRMDRAHKRYLSALKALAQVRKLALPALQVNIAEKQVNVAG